MLGGGNLSFPSHSRQTISSFDLAGFTLPSLSSLAMVGNTASVEDVNIDLYKGILSTVLENPLTLHHLILFGGCPGVIKSPFAKRQKTNAN